MLQFYDASWRAVVRTKASAKTVHPSYMIGDVSQWLAFVIVLLLHVKALHIGKKFVKIRRKRGTSRR